VFGRDEDTGLSAPSSGSVARNATMPDPDSPSAATVSPVERLA
jgi:hypothetical protein